MKVHLSVNLLLFLLLLQQRNMSTSFTTNAPETLFQLCRELQSKEQSTPFQGIFPSNSLLYILYRDHVFTVPFNSKTVLNTGKLLLETGSYLGLLSSQPWAKHFPKISSSKNLKNVYLLHTVTGKAEVNVLFEESGRLFSRTYDFESGNPTRESLNDYEVSVEYSILTDGDQRTYVLKEHDAKNPTQLLFIQHITRKSGNLTIPLKALEMSEPIQLQYWMSQSNEHFITFTKVANPSETPLAMGRFPKHFPSVGFLTKWDSRTMHLFDQKTRKVHILKDPGDLATRASGDFQLLDSVDFSAYFSCRSFFEQVLAICTAPYGVLLIGSAILLLLVTAYTCITKVGQPEGKSGNDPRAKLNIGKSMLLKLQLASSASGSSSSSVSGGKTTSTRGSVLKNNQEKRAALGRKKLRKVQKVLYSSES